jgi:hypothetical protein
LYPKDREESEAMKFVIPAALAAAAMVTLGALAHAAPAAPPQYDDYRTVLMAFVDAHGLVDYAGLKDQRSYLDDFVTDLERLDPKAYEAWSQHDKIAFWLNAYNALTLRTVIDHYPIHPARLNSSYPKNSIRQIPGEWDFNKVNVMGQSITLGYIETKILRRDFQDPRVHVALVNAAVSSPMLLNEPYEGAKLDAQLDDQARKFLSNPRTFSLDFATGLVRASEVFRWYADDFAPGSFPATYKREDIAVRKFTAPYLSQSQSAFVHEAHITYIPYDWTLNQQPQ